MLVDGDTGYGEALNVMNMVRCFEDAGAAAVHLEDQILPKKCGHLNDKKLANAQDMAAKVAAAAHARRHIFIIARTDAAASEGMDGAVARAKLYMEAGADAIFPEAMLTEEMFREFARRMPGVPLLANMTEFGKTPFFTKEQFEDFGYKMVIWPVTSLRVAAKAQEKLYAAIQRDGGTHNCVDQMLTRKDLYKTIDYDGFRVAGCDDREDDRAGSDAAIAGFRASDVACAELAVTSGGWECEKLARLIMVQLCAISAAADACSA